MFVDDAHMIGKSFSGGHAQRDYLSLQARQSDIASVLIDLYSEIHLLAKLLAHLAHVLSLRRFLVPARLCGV